MYWIWIALSLTLLVAALHVYFLVLEMFLWTRPLGLKTFRNTLEKAQATRVLAANQGLYNGFLAAGILVGLGRYFEITIFSLVCVVVAGCYGAWTVNRRIFYIQAVPALLALAAIWLAGRNLH
jgi:putative membrane protein